MACVKDALPAYRFCCAGAAMSGSEHWDGDRRLIPFANMFADAAQVAARGEDPSNIEKELIKFLNRTHWKAETAWYMIADACALLEYGANPKVYECGKLIAEGLYRSPEVYAFAPSDTGAPHMHRIAGLASVIAIAMGIIDWTLKIIRLS